MQTFDTIDEGLTCSKTKLGKGSFGVVFEGYYTDGDGVKHRAAIKMNINPGDVPSFLKESKLVQELNHPSIVKVFKSGKCQGMQQYYCAMELMQSDLSKYMAEIKKVNGKRWFSEEEAAIIFMELCQAAEHLHKRNILHRDIKPENIFMDEKMNLKLGDFGLAKVMGDSNELKHSIVGTPLYCPPEIYKAQKSGKSKAEYNKPFDMWSLGCVLYYMLTGDLYFKPNLNGDHPLFAEKAEQILIKPRVLPLRLSTACRDLISGMLAFNVEDRLSIGQVISHRWFQQLDLHDHDSNRSTVVFNHCAGRQTPDPRQMDVALELAVKDHISFIIHKEIESEINWSQMATALGLWQDLSADGQPDRDDREKDVLELVGWVLVLEMFKMQKHKLRFVNGDQAEGGDTDCYIDLLQMSPGNKLQETFKTFSHDFIQKHKPKTAYKSQKAENLLDILLDKSIAVLNIKSSTTMFADKFMSLLQSIVNIALFNKKTMTLDIILDPQHLEKSKSLASLTVSQRKKLISKLICLFDSAEKVARLVAVKNYHEDFDSDTLIKVIVDFK